MRADFLIPDWPAPGRVRALSTTRLGGVSEDPYRSLNLGGHVGDDQARVASNRARLRHDGALPDEPRWLRQVHGVEVLEDLQGCERECEADGDLSRRAGVVCAVLTADCLPVLLCDQGGSVVAAVHAGWRGLAGGILERAVTALAVAPEQILAWLGPCIGPRAFEVGGEVRDAFVEQDARSAAGFRSAQSGRYWADLPALARRRLGMLGVTAVYGGRWCTFSDPQHFFSYRRDGSTGRMASLIWLER